MAGPRQPPTVTLVPNDIKAMATRVLETCTKKTSYIGGFLTSDLGGMKQWLTSSEGDLDRPMPYSTSFLTVSLSTPHSEYFSPGDYDPCMAYIFAQFEFQAAALLPSTSWMAETLRHRGERLLRAINMMQPRGRRIPWWGDPGRPLTVLEQPGGEGNTTVEEQ
ncbi:MAG: hypothetical protein LQ338_003178 [Usnochroma carphineum]|nr:MAG: hypothetical protein LQ338_003178 [Usnochroma carphineum]